MPLTKEQFNSLIQAHGELCLTIYMPVVPNIRENATRLKFLLSEAAKRVRALERRSSVELTHWLERLGDLPEQMAWAGGVQTLCLFVAMDSVEYYFVPLALIEELNVGRQFRMGPLVALFDLPEPYFVLEPRLDQPRLFRGGLQEFVELEVPPIRVTRVGRRGELPREAATLPPADQGQYFRQLSREVRTLVRPVDSPVIVAGVEPTVSAFREAAEGLNVAGETIRLSPGETRPPQMRDKALVEIQRLWEAALDRLKDEFNLLETRQERSSSVAVEVFQAAQRGRVRELMFSYGTGLRASEVFREQLVPVSDDYQDHDDVVEAAIRETLRNGGRVHAVPQSQMPCPSRVAAVYRY